MNSPEFPYLRLTPFDHQAAHLREVIDREWFALYWQMGAAKTLPIIATAAHHFLRGDIELVIVWAPNTVHSNWILREIPKTLDADFPWTGYIWDGADTKAAELAREKLLAETGRLKFVAINFEAMSAHRIAKKNRAMNFLVQLLRTHAGKVMGVVDEADGIGDWKSAKTQRILRFAPHLKIRRIATGTPNTETPFFFYPQFEFLKPGLLGYPTYELFTMSHGVYKTKKFGTGKSFQQCVGYRNLEALRGKIAAHASFVKKKDCLDLPDKVYLPPRLIDMTPEQKVAYKQMVELLMHEVLEDGEATRLAVAKNAMMKLRRLHDITLGFTRVEVPYMGPPENKPAAPVYEVVPLPNYREQALVDLLQGIEGKALIFTESRPAIIALYARLQQEFGEGATRVIYGAIPEDERNAAQDAFQDPASPVRFLVMNQKTGGVGLTLTEASYVIYYSNAYSLRLRMQSEDRAHRAGLKHPVTYVDFVAPGTVDEKVFQAFERKIDIASQIVPLFPDFLGKKILSPEERDALARAEMSQQELDFFDNAMADIDALIEDFRTGSR